MNVIYISNEDLLYKSFCRIINKRLMRLHYSWIRNIIQVTDEQRLFMQQINSDYSCNRLAAIIQAKDEQRLFMQQISSDYSSNRLAAIVHATD